MEPRPFVVVGIDAGYANLAMVVVSLENIHRPLFHGRFRILAGKYSEQALLQACDEFFKKPEIKHWLDRADKIVLEYQKDRKFATVNMFPIVMHYEKCFIVHPNTVGAHFGLAKERKEKKKDAVELLTRNCVVGTQKGKKDDIADAYLLAMYYLKQNFPVVGWTGLQDGEANVRRGNVAAWGEPQPMPARQQTEERNVYPGPFSSSVFFFQ